MSFGFSFSRSTHSFNDVSPRQVGDLSGYRILDVRGPDEFHGPLGHLARAELVPVSMLPQRLDSLGLSPDEPILVVCHSGGRSAQAASFLASRGFTSVHNLSGGMSGWRAHGLDSCGEHHGAGLARCSKAA